MRLDKKLDRATSIVMFLLFGGLLVLSRDLGYWDEFAPSSGFAPIWVAIAGMVLALMLFFAPELPEEEPELPFDRSGVSRALLTMLGLVLFIAVTPWTGMILAGFLLMLFMLLVVLRRPLLPGLFTAVISTALVYGIFVSWLHVALPKGVLGF